MHPMVLSAHSSYQSVVLQHRCSPGTGIQIQAREAPQIEREDKKQRRSKFVSHSKRFHFKHPFSHAG